MFWVTVHLRDTGELTTISLETISIIHGKTWVLLRAVGGQHGGAEADRKALAQQLGCSYANIRRKLDGESLPSRRLMRRLCATFGWNEKKLRGFVMMDQARKKFKGSFWIVLGKNPQYEFLYILWEFLTTEEKDYFTGCARLLVARKETAQKASSDLNEG